MNFLFRRKPIFINDTEALKQHAECWKLHQSKRIELSAKKEKAQRQVSESPDDVRISWHFLYEDQLCQHHLSSLPNASLMLQ